MQGERQFLNKQIMGEEKKGKITTIREQELGLGYVMRDVESNLS